MAEMCSLGDKFTRALAEWKPASRLGQAHTHARTQERLCRPTIWCIIHFHHAFLQLTCILHLQPPYGAADYEVMEETRQDGEKMEDVELDAASRCDLTLSCMRDPSLANLLLNVSIIARSVSPLPCWAAWCPGSSRQASMTTCSCRGGRASCLPPSCLAILDHTQFTFGR